MADNQDDFPAYPLTPYPPVSSKAIEIWHLRKATRDMLRKRRYTHRYNRAKQWTPGLADAVLPPKSDHEVGTVVKGTRAPDATVVDKLEGPGWIGAAELADLVPCRHDELYPAIQRGWATQCVLLIPWEKRYYRFTEEGWREMFAQFTLKRLKSPRYG